jgi:hypothetical protein
MKRTLPRQVVPGFEAGKPGTIVENETARPRQRRGAPKTRAQRGQPARTPAHQPAVRRDAGHTRVTTAQKTHAGPAVMPPKRQAQHPTKAGNGTALDAAHRGAPQRSAPAENTKDLPRSDKRFADRQRKIDTSVRSNLPPGWPGATRNR